MFASQLLEFHPFPSKIVHHGPFGDLCPSERLGIADRDAPRFTSAKIALEGDLRGDEDALKRTDLRARCASCAELFVHIKIARLVVVADSILRADIDTRVRPAVLTEQRDEHRPGFVFS
jgi:hypothetical protein